MINGIPFPPKIKGMPASGKQIIYQRWNIVILIVQQIYSIAKWLTYFIGLKLGRLNYA